jgi:sporulation protein YlmC with PRC-barrel domain
MTRKITMAAAALAVALAAGPVPEAMAAQPPWVPAESSAMTPLGMTAGELDGRTLYSERDEPLGTVEQVLASPDGRIAGLAVELSDGVLGIGEHQVLLRFDQVRRVGDRVATLLSQAQLKAQPRWDD